MEIEDGETIDIAIMGELGETEVECTECVWIVCEWEEH